MQPVTVPHVLVEWVDVVIVAVFETEVLNRVVVIQSSAVSGVQWSGLEVGEKVGTWSGPILWMSF